MTPLKPLSLLLLHLLAYGALLSWLAPGAGWPALVLGAVLIWVSMVDFRTYEIPDTASALLAVTALVWLWPQDRTTQIDAALGAVFWPLAFWGIGALYLKARGIHGLGFGDVKLMAGIALWCGLLGTIWVVLGAALSGMAVIVLRRAPAPTTQAVAFGPFLCLSAWHVWLTGTGL
jgi:leader peptidase (prepilin peptidase)/N-methyltransferase